MNSNTDFKDLYVAVIPSEEDNDISQESTAEEIFDCKTMSLFKINDYFEERNKGNLVPHWSFFMVVDSDNGNLMERV